MRKKKQKIKLEKKITRFPVVVTFFRFYSFEFLPYFHWVLLLNRVKFNFYYKSRQCGIDWQYHESKVFCMVHIVSITLLFVCAAKELRRQVLVQ